LSLEGPSEYNNFSFLSSNIREKGIMRPQPSLISRAKDLFIDDDPKSTHLKYLDGLRGFACVQVLATHLRGTEIFNLNEQLTGIARVIHFLS
jgi:hypothetical protein